jgi:hypothetical protein
MTDPRHVIKKVRRIPKPNFRDTSMDWLTDIKAGHYMQEFWENDKIIKRDQNFKKAQAALELHKEAKQAEKERQQGIIDERLKNLKKARKALKKKRSTT